MADRYANPLAIITSGLLAQSGSGAGKVLAVNGTATGLEWVTGGGGGGDVTQAGTNSFTGDNDFDCTTSTLTAVVSAQTVLSVSSSGVWLADNSGSIIIDVNGYFINDSTGATVLDIASRALRYSDGTTVSIDWGTSLAKDSGGINSINYSARELRHTDGITVVASWNDLILYYASGIASIDWGTSLAKDSANVTSINWDSRHLYDTDGTTLTVNWDDMVLGTSTGPAVDWGARWLVESGGNTVFDWENQQLKAPNGDVALDFSDAAKYTKTNVAGINPTWSKATDVKKLYTATASAGDVTLPDATGAGMEGCEMIVIAKNNIVTVTGAVTGQILDLASANSLYDYVEVGLAAGAACGKATFTVVDGEWCCDYIGAVAFF